ncbi:ABC-type protease/lipase transport system, ATPase and permease components [Serratia marcescens]|uniref:ABC-type protease/lipase transport system, ATPase and permease components n=1 Tax=Serratia marcescens TaxID=615 RepID=A0A380ADA7_SERMA|nr:ABC-type protease/lipase transport system, ATPase and permease components [Serratia marcescens]
MFFFFNTIHGRTMGEIEFKLWSNESYINPNLNNNLFKITKELVTNTAPWPQLNDDWSINNSYEYNYPVQRQIDREHFVDNGNQALYPGSPSPSSTNETDSTADIQGIFHILGAGITRDVIEYWAPLINNHERTLLQATEKFINDRPYLSKVTNKTFIQKLFENGYERSASDNELNFYVNLLSTGISRGEIAIKLMNTLKESNNEQDHVAREHLKGASYVYKAGELPPLEYQEFIAELYLAGAGKKSKL